LRPAAARRRLAAPVRAAAFTSRNQELDAVGEWFLDAAAGALYLCVNGSAAWTLASQLDVLDSS